MNKIEKLLLVHGSDLIFVGIDVAKKNHYARIIDHIGLEPVKPFKFNNSKDGYFRLASKILGPCQEFVGKSLCQGFVGKNFLS